MTNIQCMRFMWLSYLEKHFNHLFILFSYEQVSDSRYVIQLIVMGFSFGVEKPSQIANFMGPTWGLPGSCRPQMGPMMAPWILLSGVVLKPTRSRSLWSAHKLNSVQFTPITATFGAVQVQTDVCYGITLALERKIYIGVNTYTVRCRYNAVNFLRHSHKIHPIARPLGRDMGCLLCSPILIYIWPQSLQSCMQHHIYIYNKYARISCDRFTQTVCNRVYISWSASYTAHNKFMNTSTSAESVASFILEGRYLENQTL